VTFASGAQIGWLSRAYGLSIAVALLLKIATILRLRRTRKEPPVFSTPINLRIGTKEIPVGLFIVALIVGLSAVVLLFSGDIPTIAALALIAGLSVVLATSRKGIASTAEEEEPFDLSTAPDVSLGDVQVRPDNVLVAVRHPHSLAHLVAALQEAGDRDVVIVTVRLLGVDVDDETAGGIASTADERRLFSRVVALTERYGRPVRLLIAPAHNV